MFRCQYSTINIIYIILIKRTIYVQWWHVNWDSTIDTSSFQLTGSPIYQLNDSTTCKNLLKQSVKHRLFGGIATLLAHSLLQQSKIRANGARNFVNIANHFA